VKFHRTNIPDVVIIEPTVHEDKRGYFFESYRKDIFQKEIGKIDFIQDNESQSQFGTLRGIHYQVMPYTQSKLVRVIQGSIQDVAVDLRKDSKYFGKYISVILSESNKRQLFIPKGFGHAFLTLSNTAIVSYKVDNYYSKESDRSIIFNDDSINIKWELGFENILISDKDKLGVSFKYFVINSR